MDGNRRRRLFVSTWEARSKIFRTQGPLNRQQENRSQLLIFAELTPKALWRSQDIFLQILKNVGIKYSYYWMLMIHAGSDAEKEPRRIFEPSRLCCFLYVTETQLITSLFPVWLPSLHSFQNNGPKRLLKNTVLETLFIVQCNTHS